MSQAPVVRLAPAPAMSYTTRNIQDADSRIIIPVIDQWWGGRPVSERLPRLFFTHFQDTSFAVEERGQLVAFLIGFVSQTDPKQSYVHFLGVHPSHRRKGLGGHLYGRFFETVRPLGCTSVHAVTSPMNRASILFHGKLGFSVEPGDDVVDGIQVMSNYDGRGLARVGFMKAI